MQNGFCALTRDRRSRLVCLPRGGIRGGVMADNAMASRCLGRVVDADRRTVERWRRWWVERVGGSRVFEIGRAPEGTGLPQSLLDSFIGTARERALHTLSWLARQFGSRFPTEGVGHAELAR
jgi:hypothetical protein